MFDKKILLLAIMLIIINIIAHFLPLERASFSSDEYVYLARYKNINTIHILIQMFKFNDRPLQFVFETLQVKLLEHNINLGFILLVLSNSLVLLAIFILFIQVFDDNFTAFIASVIFSLLPNTLQIYQHIIFLPINIAFIAYTLSLITFIFFTKKQKYLYLFLSLCGYFVGNFLYEVGFFLPLLYATFCYFYKKEFIKYAFYFVIPTAIYAIYRLTGAFGLSDSQIAYKVDLSGFPKLAFFDLFHSYFGRYMARSIIYGFYKFISIEHSWLIAIICFDVLILLIVFFLIKRGSLSKTNIRLCIFGVVLFLSFLLPFFLNKERGIAGRYLTMPNLGVAIIIIFFLQKFYNKWRIILISFICVTLIVCQGNAWCQVIACRIHAAIFQTFKELKDELNGAENIIIDVRSLINNIPNTLIKGDYNEFNSYYGYHVYHSEGLKSMIELVVGKNNKNFYIAIESPRLTKEGLFEFSVISEKIS